MGVFENCGIMLDMSRDGVMKVSALKDYISVLAKLGMTTFYIYLEDTYELPEYPMFGYMRGRYTADELKEIDAFCIQKGMKLVPCIQTLGHMMQYLRYPQTDAVRDTEDILLCDADETYELIESMIKTMRECISGDKLHVGMDESMALGTGKYFTLHGYQEKSEIFKKHLQRVCDIAHKYNFTPMIWDDVARDFIRLDNTVDLKDALPDVELVPWSYGCVDSEKIRKIIESNRVFNRPVTFAAGAWTWGSPLPCYNFAKATVVSNASAVADSNLESLMYTVWGDDACQTNAWFAMPQILMLSEYNRRGIGATDEELIKLSNDLDLLDFSVADIAAKFSQPKGVDTTVGKRLIWGDLFFNSGRVFDKDYSEILKKAAEDMKPFVERNDRWKEYYKYIELCLKVASEKAYIVTNLYDAYKSNNRNFLKNLCDEKFDNLIRIFLELEKCHRDIWLETYKPQGYQKVEGRYGSQIMRLEYAKDRIKDYLEGKIEALDEFNETPVPTENENNMVFSKDGEVYIDYEKWMCCRHLIDVSV